MLMCGCAKSMNSVIEKESSVSGIVKEVYENSMLITFDGVKGYHDGAECVVSLDVEVADSMTHFEVGDRVTVYFDGSIAESDPMQINKVYAITLLEPANREENQKG